MNPVNGFLIAVAAALILAVARLQLAGRERLRNSQAFSRDSYGGNNALSAPGAGSLNLERIDAAAFRAVAQSKTNSPHSDAKRFIDVALSIAMLIMLTPLFALTAIAVKLDSKGPVIYRQQRVGKNGKVFQLYKFRSMDVDAEKDGPRYADLHDGRVTRVGRIIRRFRIDELPQLINVLRNDMSLIGPRPERPEFVEILEEKIPHYHGRHMVKPGITGWAQVKYEYAASVEGARTKLQYDLYYIRHFSFWLDLAILVRTVRVVLFGLGSR